jgi:hypothetical protein
MNLNNRFRPNRRVLWRDLSPERRRRLLAQIAEMTLRHWKAQRISNTHPTMSKGGSDER